MNKKLLIGTGIIIVAIALGAIGWSTRQKQQNLNTSQPATSQLPGGIYKNKIQNSSTSAGLRIKDLTVENNVDLSGKATSDHIELSIVNDTSTSMTNIDSYITMIDTKTGTKEGYNVPLANLTIAPHQTLRVHYNGGSGANHFALTNDSLYYKSANKMTISVEISAPGYAVQTQTVSKAAGGAETKD